MPLGRCIHWSGVGCTFPDEAAALAAGLGQGDGYYEGECPRKNGAGCTENGYFEAA